MDPEGYINLGDTSQSEGNFKQAIEFYQRALSTAKEIGDKQSEEIAYHYLGNAYHSLNDFKKEIENHQQALVIAKEIQDKSLEGVTALAMLITFSVILKQQSCSITRLLASQKKLKSNN